MSKVSVIPTKGSKIKGLRVMKGKYASEIAAYLGIDVGLYNGYESGNVPIPKYIIEKLRRYYKMPI